MNDGKAGKSWVGGLLSVCLAGSVLLLGGCGSDSTGSSNTSTTVSGTAASGAPLAGAFITLHCQNNWVGSTTSNSSGQWSIAVPVANLPCAVKAASSDSSQVYYSVTADSGSSIVSNVTPLTSLALARSLGSTLSESWFNSLTDANRQTLSTNIASLVTALKTALQAKGYTLPDDFNPFSANFTATAGDGYDDLLEQLKSALTAATQEFADLLAAFAAGGALPQAPETPGGGSSCTAGDDKLVFTNAPADFCGFTKEASANTISNYYQFTASGDSGTTYVKFTLDGESVASVMIENDDYAFACGGGSPACTGVTQSLSGSNRQFTLANTTLEPVFGSTQAITVNGLLIHTTTPGTGGSDTIVTPTLETGEYGLRFASNGTIQGTPESGVTRFWSDHGGISVGSGDSAGLLTESYLVLSSPFSSFGLRNLPNSTGTYDCGYALGSLNPRNIELAYAAGQGYSSVGTRGVSGYSCSLTITHVGSISGSSYSGYVEGNFKARLFKTGATPNLATSIVVSGSFRLGQ